MIFKEDIERIGKALNIEGRFLVDWGVDNIIWEIEDKDKEIA